MKRSMGYNKVQKLIAPCVVSADDHDLFRKILSLTLEEEAGVHVVHTASTGKEAVEATLKYEPYIVLMDISMPEMDGLSALSILKYISPETPAIIITALVHPHYMARAGELGVQGFFSKGGTSKELVNAIGALLSGQKLIVEPKHMPELATPCVPGFTFPKDEPPTFEGRYLTEQEGLILSLIVMVLDNQAVMDKVPIRKNTLKTHIRNIYSKLGGIRPHTGRYLGSSKWLQCQRVGM